MTERPADPEVGASRATPRPAATRISPVVRITGLVLGFALAIGATLAVFLTDNALYLRLAVIAVAWAFVIAAFSAGRRKTDQAVAEGRENELRQAYALELEREVAARREYELKLENQLRRETQEAMRAELDKLRADLVSLAGLRDQLAGLGELRADMGRLRNELTEQLSGEMLVERIVMRTQSIRMPADRAELPAADPRLLEGTPAWGADVHRDTAAPTPPPAPAPIPAAQPEPVAEATGHQLGDASAGSGGSSVHRTSTPPVPTPVHRPADVPPPPAQPAPSPFDWLGARDRAAEAPSRHASPSQDERVARPGSAARHGTAEQPRVTLPAAPPAARTAPPPPSDEPTPAPALWDTPGPVTPEPRGTEEPPRHHRAAVEEQAPPAEPEHEPDVYETAGHQRLTQILAESGSTAGGSRRRRRYREDDDAEGDDVLARVLGQN